MSFSVHNPASGLEYNGHSLTSLFAQRRNLLKPAFWGLLSEIVRFNRLAKLALTEALDPGATLESFLTRHRFSPFFARHYILPMGRPSGRRRCRRCVASRCRCFCASLKTTVCWIFAIVRNGTWCPAVPGIRSLLLARLGDRLDLRLNAPVQQVDRHPAGSPCGWRPGRRILTSDLRLPPAQALAMLAAPTDSEREVLGTSAGSVTRWCCTAIRAGCRSASAPGPAGTIA